MDVDALSEQLLELAPDAVIAVDRNGRMRLVNAQTERCFGYTRGELLGQHVELLIVPEAQDAHVAARRRYLRAPTQRPMSSDMLLEGQRKDGSRFPVEITLGPLAGVPGLAAMAMVRDVTERRAHQRSLQWLADHDELTGLLNRRAFTRELERHLAVGRRYGPCGALLLVDLDGLKAINDTRGHQVGDAALRHAGAALSGRLRESDTAARLGGDEFAVLLPRSDRSAATDAATAILAAMRRQRDGLPAVTASIGLLMLDRPLDVRDALADADRALYAAKAAGRDGMVGADAVELPT